MAHSAPTCGQRAGFSSQPSHHKPGWPVLGIYLEVKKWGAKSAWSLPLERSPWELLG